MNSKLEKLNFVLLCILTSGLLCCLVFINYKAKSWHGRIETPSLVKAFLKTMFVAFCCRFYYFYVVFFYVSKRRRRREYFRNENRKLFCSIAIIYLIMHAFRIGSYNLFMFRLFSFPERNRPEQRRRRGKNSIGFVGFELSLRDICLNCYGTGCTRCEIFGEKRPSGLLDRNDDYR